MDKFYQDSFTTLYHGDCEEIIKHLPKVDLIVTSPPYNLNNTSGSEWSRLSNGYESSLDNLDFDTYKVWHKKIISLCWDLLTDHGAIFWNHKPRAKGLEVQLPLELLPPEILLRQILIWDRGSGFQRTHMHFVPCQEWILLLAKPDFRLTNLSTNDIWRFPPTADSNHPASFPIDLPEIAIQSSNPSLILDPFCGSGTTLRAAKNAGIKAIGIEKSKKYCELTVNRMRQEVLWTA